MTAQAAPARKSTDGLTETLALAGTPSPPAPGRLPPAHSTAGQALRNCRGTTTGSSAVVNTRRPDIASAEHEVWISANASLGVARRYFPDLHPEWATADASAWRRPEQLDQHAYDRFWSIIYQFAMTLFRQRLQIRLFPGGQAGGQIPRTSGDYWAVLVVFAKVEDYLWCNGVSRQGRG